MPYRSGKNMVRQRHGPATAWRCRPDVHRANARPQAAAWCFASTTPPLRRRQRALVYMARAIADGCRLVGPAALVVSEQRTREMAVLRQTLQPKMNQGYEAEVAPPGIPGVGKRG